MEEEQKTPIFKILLLSALISIIFGALAGFLAANWIIPDLPDQITITSRDLE